METIFMDIYYNTYQYIPIHTNTSTIHINTYQYISIHISTYMILQVADHIMVLHNFSYWYVFHVLVCIGVYYKYWYVLACMVCIGVYCMYWSVLVYSRFGKFGNSLIPKLGEISRIRICLISLGHFMMILTNTIKYIPIHINTHQYISIHINTHQYMFCT